MMPMRQSEPNFEDQKEVHNKQLEVPSGRSNQSIPIVHVGGNQDLQDQMRKQVVFL